MIKKIAPNVWKLNVDSNVYFLEKEKAVIDTGPRAYRKDVELFLSKVADFSEVKKVLFTHLHADHIGNFDLFPKAEFFASKEEIECFKKDPFGTVLMEDIAEKFKKAELKELKDFEAMFSGIKFSFVVQKVPGGDGHAILQGAKYVKNEAVANSFGDDVFDSETPALLQLVNIFKTCGAPVVGLKRLPREKIPAYGSVAVEKIANNLYKIKKIIEKPQPNEISSDFVIVGKHILTPEVFDYLKKAKPGKKGEIILAEVFDKMLDEGKTIYGYELKGEWLECGDKLKWIKSFLYMAMRDKRYKDEVKQYLKTIK